MKKLIIFILIIQFTGMVHSQIRLNSNKTEIKSEFSEDEYSLEEMKVDGIDAISIFTERVNLLYMFNSEGICKANILIPHMQGDLNYFVESFNNKYVIISDKEWKMYTDNGIAKIELIFATEKPAFRITINKK